MPTSRGVSPISRDWVRRVGPGRGLNCQGPRKLNLQIGVKVSVASAFGVGGGQGDYCVMANACAAEARAHSIVCV